MAMRLSLMNVHLLLDLVHKLLHARHGASGFCIFIKRSVGWLPVSSKLCLSADVCPVPIMHTKPSEASPLVAGLKLHEKWKRGQERMKVRETESMKEGSTL